MERPPTCLVTLNRLIGLTSMEAAGLVIDATAEPDFETSGPPVEVQVAGSAAAWFAGSTEAGSTPWAEAEGASGLDPDGRDPHRGGVLVIDVDSQFYALSFGEGYRRVRDDYRDQRFGLRVALRCLAGPELSELISRQPGPGRIESTPIDGGTSVLWIRPGNLSEIVRRIGGHALPMPLTYQAAGERPARLYGANGLRLRLGARAADLVGDLRTIAAVHDRPAPLGELAFVDDIAPVGDPKTRHRLDAEVESLLVGTNSTDPTARVGLMVPDPALPYLDQTVSYRIQVGTASSDVTTLTLADLTGPARQQPPGARLSALRTGSVSLCDLPGGRRTLNRTPAVKWIEATVRLDRRHFSLLDGVWHEFDPAFTDRVRGEVSELLTPPTSTASTSTALPGWPADWDEETYGRYVQQVSPGHLYLPGADVGHLLGPDDELIQVSRAQGSADLGHRFAEGLASWPNGPDEAGFRRLVKEVGNGRQLPPSFRPTRVVFALRLDPGHRLTPEALFPFAQAALAQTADELRERQVRLEVVRIDAVAARAAEHAA
jgi:uncharacterized protein (TIGR04141 family)